jgi:hypothetical protein
MRKLLLAAALGAALLAGCASPQIADYANETPKLVMDQYFSGKVDAYGIFRDRSGKVVRRFTVEMDCKWEGNKGTLDERFIYSDGTRQQRIWRLTLGPDGQVTGEADDVVGQARGQVRGNALQWAYTLRLPVDGKTYDVQFDDWMFLQNDQVMLNTAVMSKFGFRLGEVVLTFVKRK